MKIRAVRLREVGCFSEPVAVEGFSGALDVLAGPNELGKSTILKSIWFLFTEKQTTTKIEPLRPYSGGAPLIEADFEVDGRLWRLRKQFLSEKRTVLTDLVSGKVAARGEEAHSQALNLIGGAEQIGLLWLEQAKHLKPQAPNDKMRTRLSEVIAREIQDASGGKDLRAVRAMAVKQRSEFVTPSARQPTGEYATARKSRDNAAQALKAARMAASQAEARIERARMLRATYAQLTDPAALRARKSRLEAARAAHETATAARQRLRIADAELKAAESRLAEAERAHATFIQQLEDVRELEAKAGAAGVAEEEAERELKDCATQLAETRARRDGLRAALNAERARLKARDEADRRREARERLAQVSAHLADAEAAAKRAEELSAALAADPVSEQRVTLTETEVRSIAALEARITAELPEVRVAYLPGVAGKIRAEGRALGDGESLRPARTLELEIEGVGSVIIEPALSDKADEDRADLEAHRQQLAALLSAMGVADVDAARQRLAARRRIERELQQAEDRLAARAPAGLEALAAEADRLRTLSAGDPLPELPERHEIEAAVVRLAEDVAAAERQEEEHAERHALLSATVARLAAEREARASRLAALSDALPDPEQRAERLAALEAQRASASAAAGEARRERSVWADKAPDETAMRKIAGELDAATEEDRKAQDDMRRVERELAVLERDLERDCEEGIEVRVAELEDAIARWNARVAQLESDLAALDLLIDTLDAVERQSRDRYMEPVIKRLEAYARLVFPEARFALGRDLEVESLARGAVAERLSSLSEGTQEQIAVLVRLAFGRLLADWSRPTPLILDDALVYSDDSRIEALFTALREAAGAHQVIVLTCRSRTFERLGGTRLAIRPWSEA